MQSTCFIHIEGAYLCLGPMSDATISRCYMTSRDAVLHMMLNLHGMLTHVYSSHLQNIYLMFLLPVCLLVQSITIALTNTHAPRWAAIVYVSCMSSMTSGALYATWLVLIHVLKMRIEGLSTATMFMQCHSTVRKLLFAYPSCDKSCSGNP